ncbi:MAG TPA: glycoside hydrolase family 127 protein [Candidatus Bathyarchaeia archaeon]|nr:glycoside hydrolase family 127 protein [Candidatus Bathyarchaeia archaeon]
MTRFRTRATLFIATILFAVLAAAQEGRAQDARDVMRLEPFPLTQVRLLEGRWNDEMQRDRQYLHDLDVDRLLYPFRKQAGLEAPGDARPYGGWEAMSCEVRGHFPGHFLSACALMFASTGDAELKAKADAMVGELAKCQAANGGGYLAAFPQSFWDRLEAGQPVWAPYYVIHKIMAGLYDMHTLCGNDQALDVLKGMAGYFKSRLDKLPNDAIDRMLRVEFGGMSEVLHNLYRVTGDPAHLELAHRFDQPEFLGPLALSYDNLSHIHGNTQIPKVIGAATRYEITGDTRYRLIAEFFWDRVVNTRTYATGGSTMFETWPQPNRLAGTLGHLNHETCKTHNMLKLTRHILGWTADPVYGDFYERALLNGILGTQGPHPGELQYYVAMAAGYPRTFGTPDNSFWCCYGTGVESWAKLGDSIYFQSRRDARTTSNLYVNLYIPSRLDWIEEGVQVDLQTDYPREDTVRLRLSMTAVSNNGAPKSFALSFRVPHWVSGHVEARVNGAPAGPLDIKRRSWLTLERVWNDGDLIELRLPMALHTMPLPDDPETVAVLYGPVVLAGVVDERAGQGAIIEPVNDAIAAYPMSLPPLYIAGDPKAPDTWLTPVEGKPLTFTPLGGRGGVAPLGGVALPRDRSAPSQPLIKRLVPFSDIVTERYALYFPVVTPGSDRHHELELAAERWESEIDRVFIYPNESLKDVSEHNHGLKTKDAAAGAIPGTATIYRHATPGGWFEWNMKVLPDVPASLLVTYWGSDVGRNFDILIDGTLLKTEQLNNLNPGRLVDVEYALPQELTRNKNEITVRFLANHNTIAGGVFGCATLRAQ